MRLFPLLFLLASSLAPSALASVLAIDYGAEFTKISLVKPGLPMDVVLNKDSKRKVQSVVGWKKDERLFGGEAAAVSGRFPHDTFPYLKPHLGSSHSDDTTTLFPSVITPTSRKTVGFTRPSAKEHWSVEELIGMQFSYARELAESLAGEAVKDAVVVVPGWFNQFERQAVMDALEIGGLKSLGLINEGTAVAMNYAMTRVFPTKEHHLIFDSGSLSTSATVISFHTYLTTPVSPLLTSTNKKSKFKPKQVNTTHIEVLGLGWDRELGGTMLDEMIKEQLIAEFEAKVLKGNKISGKEKEKALAKVAKEAAKVKSVLSANSDSSVNIESFFDDHDYRSRFTREQLETSAASIISEKKYEKPIWDALKMANLTVADLDSLILFGGNSRVPMVQAAIKAAVGEEKIAQNVNTDEAAVLGAAFYGATLSRQFKTKEVKVIDLTPYDIQTSYLAESKTAADKPRTINTLLFPVGSKTLVKKTLKLKRKADFDLTFSYRTPSTGPLPFPTEIYTAKITGLTQALANLTDSELALNPDPVVRITIQLSESGMVQVVEATAILEAPKVVESLGSKLKGLFGGSKTEEEEEAEVEKEAIKTEEDKKVEGKGSNSTAEGGEKKEDKIVEKLVPLKVDLEIGAVKPMSPAEKNASRTRLLVIDAAELARRAREEAMNVLEGYLYRLRGMLSPDQEGSIFFEFSTADERDRLQTGMRDTLAWLEEEGWQAETKELRAKREALELIESPIQFRNTEAQKRAGSLEKFQKALFAGRAFIQSHAENLTLAAAQDPPLPSKYTDEEITAIKLTMAGLEEWLGRKMDAQQPLKPNEDPVLLVKELEEKGVKFQDLVLGMLRRKDPVVKKEKPAGKKEKAGKKAEEEVVVEGDAEEEVVGKEEEGAKAEEGGEKVEEEEEQQTPPVRTKDEL